MTRKNSNLLDAEIERQKSILMLKARRNGISENFGQKECSKTMDKYDYHELVIGTVDDRLAATRIDLFIEWCQNFDMSQIKR